MNLNEVPKATIEVHPSDRAEYVILVIVRPDQTLRILVPYTVVRKLIIRLETLLSVN